MDLSFQVLPQEPEKFCVSPPPSNTFVPEKLMRASSRFWLVIRLMTPAMASEPYTDEAPSFRISVR